jgi:molybdopterin-containing oxidoreductase family membrane subunit
MFEKALKGGRYYWTLIGILSLVVFVGFLTYLFQMREGLTVTGLSRDVPWGFYIAQFTFLVGVAASAVMVVLPYYLHNHKSFGRLTVLGEFLAIAACGMCMLFVFVDMGQPMRVLNMMLHPTPNSLMFWDFLVLSGYLLLNVVISQVTFGAERKGVPPPKWIKPVIVLSIPWAVSIHTVTAFLYSGLEARARTGKASISMTRLVISDQLRERDFVAAERIADLLAAAMSKWIPTTFRQPGGRV